MGILRSSFKRSKAPACKRKEHSVMFRLWKICVSASYSIVIVVLSNTNSIK